MIKKLLSLSLLGLTLSGMALGATVADHGIFHYQFEQCPAQDQYNDSSVEFDGSCNGITEGQTGKFGEAFDFGLDNNAYVDTGITESDDLYDDVGAFTFGSWVKIDSTNQFERIVSAGRGPNNDNDAVWDIRSKDSGTRATLTTTQNTYSISTNNDLEGMGWTYVAVTYDGTNYKLYEGCSSTASKTTSASGNVGTDSNGNLILGMGNSNSESMNGLMDEPRFFSGSALTGEEINALCTENVLNLNEAPTIDTANVNNADYTENATFDFTATDPDGSISNQHINVYKDGMPYLSSVDPTSNVFIDEKYIDWTFEFVAQDDSSAWTKENVTVNVDNKFPLLDVQEVLSADTTTKFVNWKQNTSNIVIEDNQIEATDLPAEYITDKFKVEKSENLNVTINKTSGINAEVIVKGYKNDSVVEQRSMSLTNYDNTLDVSEMNGTFLEVTVNAEAKDSASGNQTFIVKRMVYSGKLESFIGGTVVTNTETITNTVTKLPSIGSFFEGSFSVPNIGMPDLSFIVDPIANIPNNLSNFINNLI